MSASFSISVRPHYLHMRLDPGYEITPETVVKQWTAVAAACQESGIYRVLIEGRIAARKMETLDALDSASLAANLIPGMSLALCYYDYTTDDLSQFFLNAAYNRGVRAKFFTDLPAALKWLDANPADYSPEQEKPPGQKRQTNGAGGGAG